MKYIFLVSHWTPMQALVVAGMIIFCLVANKLIEKYQDWMKKRQ
jgi:hypothetical protein